MDDPDNPEWTEADFARARPATELSGAMLSAFPKTAARVRGPQNAPAKIATSIRLDPAVVSHFKSGGPGWQTRINDTLLAAIDRKRG